VDLLGLHKTCLFPSHICSYITYEFIGSNQMTVEESNLGQAHRILDSARRLSMTRVHHGNFINFRLAMQEF
jgi:hypothetical protein